ncbi:hypothetical protein [Pseudonocardia sp.]|jgi:hypothetical protein|uniref:hypothetical protein n=1 Tax=Pseudonocardia sp. TaxID=60912 RepID=UPI0031FD18B0
MALRLGMGSLGRDRNPHPFEDMREAAAWFDILELNETDPVKIARINAQKLLRL